MYLSIWGTLSSIQSTNQTTISIKQSLTPISFAVNCRKHHNQGAEFKVQLYKWSSKTSQL